MSVRKAASIRTPEILAAWGCSPSYGLFEGAAYIEYWEGVGDLGWFKRSTGGIHTRKGWWGGGGGGSEGELEQ